MSRRLLFHFAVALLVMAMPPSTLAAAPRDTAPPTAIAQKIDALARPYVDGGFAVGFVIGVVDGGAKHVRPYGRVAKDSDGAPDGETVYEIGSISKAFTGILLALAAGAGEVKLGDPLQSLLPETVRVPTTGDRPVTLADVATHTSGLPRMPSNFAPKDPRNPYADYSVAQMYEFLGACRPARPPGTAYEYSNFAMGLLGHALALKAGTSYEDLLVRSIAGPLGMTSTRIELTPDMTRRLAPGHDAALGASSNWDIPTLAGAGGIRSTVNDMLAFIAANLETDATPLSKAMTLARAEQWRAPGGGQPAIGLGWHLDTKTGHAWHNGATGGYHSIAIVDASKGKAVVVLSNTSTDKIDELGRSVMAALAGEDVKPISPRVEASVPIAALESCVGRYALAPTFVMEITLGEGRLHVQATGQPKFPLFATSETEYFLKVVDARLTFEKAEKPGEPHASLTLHQNGISQKAPRQP